MSPIEIAQSYFGGWYVHEPAAFMNTLAPTG